MGRLIKQDQINVTDIEGFGYTTDPYQFSKGTNTAVETFDDSNNYNLGARFQCRTPCEIVGLVFKCGTFASPPVSIACRLWNGSTEVRYKLLSTSGAGLVEVYFDTPYSVTEEDLFKDFTVSIYNTSTTEQRFWYASIPSNLGDATRYLGKAVLSLERPKRFSINSQNYPSGSLITQCIALDPIVKVKESVIIVPDDLSDNFYNSKIEERWTQSKGPGSAAVLTETADYLQIDYTPGATAEWYGGTYTSPYVRVPVNSVADFEASVFVEGAVLTGVNVAGLMLLDSLSNARGHRLTVGYDSGYKLGYVTLPTTAATIAIPSNYAWIRFVKQGDALYWYYTTLTFEKRPQTEDEWIFIQKTTFNPYPNTLDVVLFTVAYSPAVTSFRFKDFRLKFLNEVSKVTVSKPTSEWKYINDILPDGVGGTIQALYKFDGTIYSLRDRIPITANDLVKQAGTERYTLTNGLKGLLIDSATYYAQTSTNSNLQIKGDLTVEFLGSIENIAGSASLIAMTGAVTELEVDNLLYKIQSNASSKAALDTIHEYSTGSNQLFSFDGTLVDYQLSLLTYVRDSVGTTLYLYINGILIDQVAYSTNPTGGGNAKLTLGAESSGIQQWPYAVFNSLRITDSAFTAAQVKESYDRIRGLI